jgi:branched-chain amino acid transport system substrate-binding protein
MIGFQRLKPVAVGAGAALALIACGGTGGGGGSTNKGTIEIGVEMPLSGTDASQGQPILNGVQLAVQNHSTINGYTIKVKSYDDAVQGTHDPAKGAQNVQAMVGDSKILGMVGPLNSSVGKAEIPIASDAGLTMVSPANTNECLTRDDLGCNGLATQLRKGNPNSYFRLVTIDTNQGPGAAYYAYQQLHITKIAVGSDNETYGKGIADAFQGQFEKLGGTVVKRQDFDWKTTDNFKPFLQAAKDQGAQGVYWGGVTATKSCIPRAQMKDTFPVTTPYLGGDGIVTDPSCVKDAGDMSPNVYATIAAIDPGHVPGAKSVTSQYDSKYGHANRTGYAIIAYDCAGVLLDAIGRAINDAGGNMPKRTQVRDEMTKTNNFQGVLGPVNFDEHGDTRAKIISVYEYTSTDPNQAANAPFKGSYDFGKTPPKFTS